MKNLDTFKDKKLILMCSGGSDSTALVYKLANLCDSEELERSRVLVFHFDHGLHEEASVHDAVFVECLAAHFYFKFSCKRATKGQIQDGEGQNLEGSARVARFSAAFEAAKDFAKSESFYLLTAHTLDDRIETFFMRSIVGTGPGGLRSITFDSGIPQVKHPLIDCTRAELREYLENHPRPFFMDGQLGCEE